MTLTFHPLARSWRVARASRITFARNFLCQKDRFAFGVLARPQPGCRCQKHPFTNRQTRCSEKTRSGVPGRSRQCRRNGTPNAWAAAWTERSAFVFERRTRLISALLWLVVAGIT